MPQGKPCDNVLRRDNILFLFRLIKNNIQI